MNLGWACDGAGAVVDAATLALSLARRSPRTTVFTFHSIAKPLHTPDLPDETPFHRPDVFKRFLGWLADHTSVVPPNEIGNGCIGMPPQTRKATSALTFDDGFLDHYTTVFPLLRTFGMTATFFVPTGLIGRPGGVSRSMVREMADYGMTIGSHSVSHCELSQCDSAEIFRELTSSKSYIEDLTGRPCEQIAYPYGNYSELVKQIARDTGYERAFASTPSTGLSDTFAMPRICIPDTLRTWRYAAALHDAGRWRRSLGRRQGLDRFVHAALGYNSERLNWPRSMR